MDETQKVYVLWSHTDGELPRLEMACKLRSVAEAHMQLLDSIWQQRKQFEITELRLT